MESGLEDRNNESLGSSTPISFTCLNGVRPRRPEQLWPILAPII